MHPMMMILFLIRPNHPFIGLTEQYELSLNFLGRTKYAFFALLAVHPFYFELQLLCWSKFLYVALCYTYTLFAYSR